MITKLHCITLHTHRVSAMFCVLHFAWLRPLHFSILQLVLVYQFTQVKSNLNPDMLDIMVMHISRNSKLRALY